MNYNINEDDDSNECPCPKIDYWEKQIEKADRLRDEQKDRMLEAAWEKQYEKNLPAHHEQG